MTGKLGNSWRLFNGCFGLNYKVRLGKKGSGQYSAAKFLWWDILETASPTSNKLM